MKFSKFTGKVLPLGQSNLTPKEQVGAHHLESGFGEEQLGGPGGQQVYHGPAMRPCDKGGQHPPGLH